MDSMMGEIAILRECDSPHIVRYLGSFQKVSPGPSPPLASLSSLLFALPKASFVLSIRYPSSNPGNRTDRHAQALPLDGHHPCTFSQAVFRPCMPSAAGIRRCLMTALLPKDNDFWIAMEYCNAGSVADLMEASGSPLASEDLVAAVIFSCVQGLSYLHSLRRIHRC
jgi:serine/threonine protein kinase